MTKNRAGEAGGTRTLCQTCVWGRFFKNAPKHCQGASTRKVLNATGVSAAWKAGWAVQDSTGVSVVTSPRAIWDRVSNANLVIVRAIYELTTMESNTATRWKFAFAIIAMGKAAISKDAFARNDKPDLCAACVRHLASATLVPCRIGLSKAFAEKHRAMQHMFQFAAELNKSKWIVKILETDSGLGVDHVVTSPADAWLFLHRVRRLARQGGLWRGPLLA